MLLNNCPVLLDGGDFRALAGKSARVPTSLQRGRGERVCRAGGLA